jgi:hypothetical protein
LLTPFRVPSVFHPWLKPPQNQPFNFHAKLKNSYFFAEKSAGFVAAVPPVATVFDA